MDLEVEANVFARFTINAKSVIQKGYSYAKEYSYSEFLPIHLFYSVLCDSQSVSLETLKRLGIDIESTIVQFKKRFEENKQSSGTEYINNPMLSDDIKSIIKESLVIASESLGVYVGTEHLLLAIFKHKGIDFVKDINTMGISYEILKKNLTAFAPLPFEKDDSQKSEGDFDLRSEGMLSSFSRDMNEMSENGVFPKISGRDEEIKRMIHILARKTKNNPILVGEAGVGKTAIVEGLVNSIVAKKVPASLINKRIVSLDVSSIIAGAKLRGDVEERLNSILSEVIEDNNTIIFIDEIHTIVGAGVSGGRESLDIANILKPYLTSSISIIGATTHDEYSRYFESDSALARRFQPIYIDELKEEDAIKVILNVIPEFEDYHKVKISEEVVATAVNLSSKYIKDRYLPDKAIDVIDEAAASVKIGREIDMEPQLSKLGGELIKVQQKKEDALKKENFKDASEYKERENKLIDEIEDVIDGKKNTKLSLKRVTPDLVKQIIVNWTKIPIAASDISDKKLINLGKNLKKRVIGQDRIIDNLTLAIQRSHLGLNDDKRPLGSFLFLGPTGVGKTETAKVLAHELFGSENLLFQVNMSEYMESHSVSKLIGSPPGYIGYQEGGQLTTYIKRKPYSVILFDEIEKAHPDVLNLLLQILEEGEITDGKGLKVSLKNTIVIMTSNIGAENIARDSKLGFDVNINESGEQNLDGAYLTMRDNILEDLRRAIRPEILNRIDLIDIFRGLNKEDCLLITRNHVNDLILKLISKSVFLRVSDKVIEYINQEGYSKEYGGRNIRRKVTEVLENSLAKYLLQSSIKIKKGKPLKLFADLMVANDKSEVIFIVEK